MSQSKLQSVENRSLRALGCAATVCGTNNTAVVAFNAASAAWQGCRYPVGTAFTAAAAATSTWICNTVDSVSGSAFKFVRRGRYTATIMAETTTAYTLGAQLGITLDATAAQMLVGGSTIVALSDINLGFWTMPVKIGTISYPVVLSAPVYITDALAAGAQPVAGSTGVSGVGVLRFIASDNASGLISTALVVATIRATIAIDSDVAG